MNYFNYIIFGLTFIVAGLLIVEPLFRKKLLWFLMVGLLVSAYIYLETNIAIYPVAIISFVSMFSIILLQVSSVIRSGESESKKEILNFGFKNIYIKTLPLLFFGVLYLILDNYLIDISVKEISTSSGFVTIVGLITGLFLVTVFVFTKVRK